MRTAEEIRRWIERQPWFTSFWLQTKACRPNEIYCSSYEDLKRILSGQNGAHTLLGAFDWLTSIEGLEFWKKENNRFKNWYYEKRKTE